MLITYLASAAVKLLSSTRTVDLLLEKLPDSTTRSVVRLYCNHSHTSPSEALLPERLRTIVFLIRRDDGAPELHLDIRENNASHTAEHIRQAGLILHFVPVYERQHFFKSENRFRIEQQVSKKTDQHACVEADTPLTDIKHTPC